MPGTYFSPTRADVPSSRCHHNIFEDDEMLIYHADLLKMKNQKTFIDSEVKYSNIGTLRQTKLHSVHAQLSAEDMKNTSIHNDSLPNNIF